eukprot:CAMPEP_0184714984 /NCGR_PEP_ID=MMETSP0314-20130426/5000_1 /TAXON_ID=38298 /ORGANISM="Rhodella maculata, Strain CCMP 736" /LENGTH=169 /DNA_ID=CAMNT_0027178013 /DNA_START=156 /DNA_END=662 /DNA_ORIENTATION=+
MPRIRGPDYSLAPPQTRGLHSSFSQPLALRPVLPPLPLVPPALQHLHQRLHLLRPKPPPRALKKLLQPHPLLSLVLIRLQQHLELIHVLHHSRRHRLARLVLPPQHVHLRAHDPPRDPLRAAQRPHRGLLPPVLLLLRDPVERRDVADDRLGEVVDERELDEVGGARGR